MEPATSAKENRHAVPERWVELATSAKAETRPGVKIGYLWWTGHHEFDGRRLRYFCRVGYGGQAISYVLELDLLIVFTCWSRSQDAEY